MLQVKVSHSRFRGAYSVGIKNDDGSYGSAIKPLILIDNVEGDLDMLILRILKRLQC